MRYSPGCSGDGCDCESCVNLRIITSWGADSTTIGNGATEQNGNWEILSGKLRVATADAIITWDAGVSNWAFYADTSAMSWDIPGSLATDYTKEIRFIWNFVDNSNYDYASVRSYIAGLTYYFVSFGSRSGGVDTIFHPTGTGGDATAKQFALRCVNTGIQFQLRDEVFHCTTITNSICPGGNTNPDGSISGLTFNRTRVNDIVGIGTGPSWAGNADFNDIYITSPAPSPCSFYLTGGEYCWWPARPFVGCTNDVTPMTMTITIAGSPQTAYIGGTSLNIWNGATASVQILTNGTIQVSDSGGNVWELTNGGSERTDCDAITSLNIPPVAPEVRTCTITGNY